MFASTITKIVVASSLWFFFYSLILTFFLRFGSAGPGARVCQFVIAMLLPSLMIRRTFFKIKKGKGHGRLTKPVVGMLAAGLFTPSFLTGVPALSLFVSSMIATAPFWYRKMSRFIRICVSSAGLKLYHVKEDCTVLDLIVVKKMTMYFRCMGGSLQKTLCKLKKVDKNGYDFVIISRIGMTEEGCRTKMINGLAKELKSGDCPVLIPASEMEISSLNKIAEFDGETVHQLSEEQLSFLPLTTGKHRRLTYAFIEDDGKAVTADVFVKKGENGYVIKILSGKYVRLNSRRFRDVVNLYEMKGI